jgi:hypothetical protein
VVVAFFLVVRWTDKYGKADIRWFATYLRACLKSTLWEVVRMAFQSWTTCGKKGSSLDFRYCASIHRRNLAKGVEGRKSTMGIRNVQSIQLRKRRKIGLKQALIYTHPFPLLPPPPTVARNSYLPPLQLNSQILFLGRKNWEGHLLPPRPLASYACVSILAEHLIKKTRNIDV